MKVGATIRRRSTSTAAWSTNEDTTIFQPEGDKVTGIQLKAGLNVLEFGVVRANLHGWGGSVWITEADGQAVKGIKVTLDPDAVR